MALRVQLAALWVCLASAFAIGTPVSEQDPGLPAQDTSGSVPSDLQFRIVYPGPDAILSGTFLDLAMHVPRVPEVVTTVCLHLDGEVSLVVWTPGLV